MVDESLVNHDDGTEVRFVEKQVPVKVGPLSLVFEIMLWVLGVIPGLIFLVKKIKAKNYLRGLQQKIQQSALQVDSYIEQRAVIFQNAAALLKIASDLDKDVMLKIMMYKANGKVENDALRNEVWQDVQSISKSINVEFEAYPNLKGHKDIADVMSQNSYLEEQITNAIEEYNKLALRWNQDIFKWPTKMIVAARNGYTSRILLSNK